MIDGRKAVVSVVWKFLIEAGTVSDWEGTVALTKESFTQQKNWFFYCNLMKPRSLTEDSDVPVFVAKQRARNKRLGLPAAVLQLEAPVTENTTVILRSMPIVPASVFFACIHATGGRYETSS